MQLSHFTEKQLVQTYLKGNEAAIEELINRHKEAVYTYIICKVRNQALAEDLFQDTFIKVINTIKRRKYNDEGKFLPWVMRIAHNLSVDYFRNNKKMPIQRDTEEFSLFSVIQDTNPNIENQIIGLQIENDLKRLVEELPADQKEVLVMRIYQDLSFKEISEITGVSINTALGRMRYALMNLRKIIEKKNLILSQ